MKRTIITQDKLDVLWSLYERGVKDEAELVDRTKLSSWMVREIVKENRRIARNCDPNRRATAAAKLNELVKAGVALYDAARQTGFAYEDAARERHAYLKAINDSSHRHPLKPRHVTAPEGTGEWFDQQNEAFCKAMQREHPEMVKGMV